MDDQSFNLALLDMCHVSRCTSDVLKCIFEAAVAAPFTPGDHAFQVATRISHVCRSWRLVAINTPRLWTTIEFSCFRSLDAIQTFMERMMVRAKAVPVYISIWNVQAGESRLKISDFGLNQFRAVQRLLIQMEEDYSVIQQLFDPSSCLRYCLITELKLVLCSEEYGDPWRCQELFIHFPLLRRLELIGCKGILFEKAEPNDAITRLLLIDMTIDPEEALSLFPKLECLELRDVTVHLHERESLLPIELHNMRTLKVYENLPWYLLSRMDWLYQLSCPVLQEVDLDPLREGVLPFISSHPSILSFHSGDLDEIVSLDAAAPQLHHLGIEVDHDNYSNLCLIATNTRPLFPHLRSLTIRDFKCGLRLQQFELLTRTRCLPRSNPQSQLHDQVPPLQTLEILLPKFDRLDSHEWVVSELYTEARKVTGMFRNSFRDEMGLISVQLSWIHGEDR